MKITITHSTDTGRADDWISSSDALPRKGIGKTWGDALESLVRANLPELGITELEILDPMREDESLQRTVWMSQEDRANG